MQLFGLSLDLESVHVMKLWEDPRAWPVSNLYVEQSLYI